MKNPDIAGAKVQPFRCQLYCLEPMFKPTGKPERMWQFRHRFKRIVKRRMSYLYHFLSERFGKRRTVTPSSSAAAPNFQPGDAVRIKSEEEIEATLDRWNCLKGCAFMEEMWPYCGTKQHVFKRVRRFLDERDYLTRRSNGIVLLDRVTCEGTKDFGPCDRACFFFWREEWLEKID